MKRDQLEVLFVCIVAGVVIGALVSGGSSKGVSQANPGILQEINGGVWNQPAMYAPNYGMAAALMQAPPIAPGQKPPTLIKELGMEVMDASGGKVKVTGVMGASWADRAGLRAGDIILRFNNKKFVGLKEFQVLVTAASPEKDYPVRYLRDGAVKKTLVTVGEGEMEGFTPIVAATPAAFGRAGVAPGMMTGPGYGYGMGMGGGWCMFRCPQCGNAVHGQGNGTMNPACPMCRWPMQRVR